MDDMAITRWIIGSIPFAIMWWVCWAAVKSDQESIGKERTDEDIHNAVGDFVRHEQYYRQDR